jgi:hypothetical protein
VGAVVLVTTAERLQEAEERLEELEADRERLVDLARSLAGALEHLAILAGASPAAAAAPARAALTVLQGGRA